MQINLTSNRTITMPEVPCCMFAAPRPGVGGMTTYICALHGSKLLPHTPEQEVAFVSKVVHSMTPEARSLFVAAFVEGAAALGLAVVPVQDSEDSLQDASQDGEGSDA